MTPPHFQIGQEVEIIGPDKLGCEFDLERFIISMLWKDDQMYYSAEHQPWYPASSLRLVEDLQVGDWVEVIGKPMPLYAECLEHEIGRIFEITQEDTKNHEWFSCQCNPTYPPTSLRKLTPDEIAKHLGKFTVEQRLDSLEDYARESDKRLTATEKRQEQIIAEQKEFRKYTDHLKKRLDILEGERPETIMLNEGCEVSRALYERLMEDKPEPCHRNPKRNCALNNVVNRMDCAICEEVAQKVLDSMKEV